MSAILLLPTTVEGNVLFNAEQFMNHVIKVRPSDYNKWFNVFVNNKGWTETLQYEFEFECDIYWKSNGMEEGFFPGTAVKEEHKAKMLAKAEAPKFSTNKDLRNKDSAKRVMEAKIAEYEAQSRKTAMCEAQYEQSRMKLIAAKKAVDVAIERYEQFKDAIDPTDL